MFRTFHFDQSEFCVGVHPVLARLPHESGFCNMAKRDDNVARKHAGERPKSNQEQNGDGKDKAKGG